MKFTDPSLVLTALLPTVFSLPTDILPSDPTPTCPLPALWLEPRITDAFAITVDRLHPPTDTEPQPPFPAALNVWQAGGGDYHLYLAPAGSATSNNTLVEGVLQNFNGYFGAGGQVVRAVINGEVSAPFSTLISRSVLPHLPRLPYGTDRT